MPAAESLVHMRLLREILTSLGAACLGLALGGYVAASFPQLYRVDNIVTVPRCDLLLSTGIASFIIAYGLRWPALVARCLGCFAYIILMGYFLWRTVMRLELSSFFVLIALIAALPFAAMWLSYAKLFLGENKDR